MNAIYFCKALHVVGFVSWFAGLFYLGRMFVNHAEVDTRPASDRAVLWPEYIGMEWRVYRLIANPAMMITWLAGLAMLTIDLTGIQTRAYFSTGTAGWLHLKLFLLVLLTAYHLYCKRLIRRMEAGERPLSPWQLRLWNEVPTLFLVSIPFTAVYGIGGRLNYGYLAVGVLLFAGMIYRGAVAYRKRRAADTGA
jgi:putative membrane protein